LGFNFGRKIPPMVVVNTGLERVKKSSPVTGLEWPIGFQEVKVPKFHENGTGWW